jgi:hypothetical protein
VHEASYLVWAIVIAVTVASTAIIIVAALTGRTGDPGVERDE